MDKSPSKPEIAAGMTIVHLLKHCNEGNGHVHVAVDLACTQARLGAQVVFGTAGGSYENLLEDYGVKLLHVPETRSIYSAAKATWQLFRRLRRLRPDIIHAHMMSSAVIGYILAKILRIPLVTTVHNSFDRHSRLMRLGTRSVAVSEFDRDLLLSQGYSQNRLVTVLNGAIESPRQPAGQHSAGILPNPAIVTLCGLHRRKAVEHAIEAFSMITPEAPAWSLVIIGDGPDRQRLEDLAARLQLQDSVHFLGSVLRPQGLLEQAQIFVSTSLSEPFGLAVAEARAAGCAIIATRVGGVPEVLDHGRSGILVPPSRPDAIAGMLRQLVLNDHQLSVWQERALEGSEQFSVERMTNDYVQLYRSLTR